MEKRSSFKHHASWLSGQNWTHVTKTSLLYKWSFRAREFTARRKENMQSFLKECKEDPLLWRTLIAEEHGKRTKGFHCCKDSQCSSQTPQEVLEAIVPRYLSCSKVWPLGDRIDPGNQELALLINGKKKAASPSSSTCTCRCAEYNNLSIFGAFERREESCLIIHI